ncbi:MAG: hypothetical protein LRY68_04395 [Sulfurospirillum sp.]|nr:hypothetical protein [Sulfurospirillum sp.]
MTYAKAFGITAMGMILMSFESPLIKMTLVSAQNFTFYFGLCMFTTMNLTLFLKHKTAFFALYKKDFLIIFASGFCIALSNLFFYSGDQAHQCGKCCFYFKYRTAD